MKPENSPEIVVSIIMITYNHEDYICKAIEGVLMQKTKFPIELIIADDASLDNTQEIIKRYEQKPPFIIKPILRNTNIGANNNWMDAYNRSAGKYIALCEGDDFWTDPLKLQKQVDFLEKNSDYSICTHRTLLLREGVLENDHLNSKPTESNGIDLAGGNYLRTLSAVFRVPASGLPPMVEGIYLGDHFMWLYLAQFGSIKTLEEVMGVYRVHKGGLWTGGDKEMKKEKLVNHYKAITKYFRKNRQLFIALRSKYVYLCLNNWLTFSIGLKFSKALKYAFLSFRFGISKGHFNFILIKYGQRY